MSLDDGGDGLSILWPGSHHGGPLVGAPGPHCQRRGVSGPQWLRGPPPTPFTLGGPPRADPASMCLCWGSLRPDEEEEFSAGHLALAKLSGDVLGHGPGIIVLLEDSWDQ